MNTPHQKFKRDGELEFILVIGMIHARFVSECSAPLSLISMTYIFRRLFSNLCLIPLTLVASIQYTKKNIY